MFLRKSFKRKLNKEWTVYDLGLPFYTPRKELKKKVKKLSSKRTRKLLKKFD